MHELTGFLHGGLTVEHVSLEVNDSSDVGGNVNQSPEDHSVRTKFRTQFATNIPQ